MFCGICCKRDDNQCPKCLNGFMKNPNKIIRKIYSKYEIACNVCCLPCPILEITAHEINC